MLQVILGWFMWLPVSNSGPSDADNIQFSDTVSPGFNITSWSCSADTGSSCSSYGPNNNSNVNPTLDLQSGDSATINVTVSYDGSLTAANLTYAVGAAVTDGNASDPTPANASDVDSRNAISNLSISVDTSVASNTTYTPGSTETYLVVVSNSGPSDVSAVTVKDNKILDSSEFSSITWSCAATGSNSCGAMSDTGALDTTASIVKMAV